MTSASREEANRRVRVVHGWAFRNLTAEEIASIRQYLRDGTMDEHFPNNYRRLDGTVK